jgi:hypothetical protein
MDEAWMACYTRMQRLHAGPLPAITNVADAR